MFNCICLKKLRTIGILTTLSLLCIFNLCCGKEDTKSLPFCGGSPKPEKSLVIVSTLDGHISALNLLDEGSETWSILTEPGPLLSSSIHKLELTNSGQWVRMIPSLSGSLYKFNREYLEPIPITVDNLLEASFRYSDDVVISGGKESRSYGVEMETGKVLYECSMGQCGNLSQSVGSTKDMIILQRLTQTVRAVDPRTGNERWNFSVGQHDMKFLPDENSDCHHSTTSTVQVNLKVIVPEGLLCAMSVEEPTKVLWQHKFKSPIVNAWRFDDGNLVAIDMFGSSYVGDDIPDSPDIYVGMHNKQLYIQESVAMQKKLQSSAMGYQQHLISDESKFPQIPWYPVPATGNRLLELPHKVDDKDVTSLAQLKDVTSTTALSVLYASEYVNGNGYYLYSTQVRKHPEKGGQCLDQIEPENNFSITTMQEDEYDDDTEDDPYGGMPIQIVNIHTSFWYWWKEVLIISLLLAGIFNLFLNKKLYKYLHNRRYSTPEEDLIAPIHLKQTIDNSDPTRKYSESSQDSNQEYISRYLTDFDPIHCLGKGGFGVVFQARNKIDDCDYAIKRISLPNRKESKERVMREVKALAKLDHQHIVRYFNAWMECPPSGWQEEQDQTWKDKARDDFLSSLDEHTSDISSSKASHLKSKTSSAMKKSNKSRLQKSIFSNNFITNSKFFKKISNSLQDRKKSSKDAMENSDSYIIFENTHEDESDTSLRLKKKTDTVTKDDSYIVFEASGDHPQDDQHNSVIDISSSVDKSKSKAISRKRPKSLSIYPEENTNSSSRLYLYIQMQLCRKDSLREWLSENILQRDQTEIVNIFEQIVHAVEYVHMQGLIHRDLKPSNIFFSLEGQIKVGDFGLVTAMSEGDMSPTISSKSSFIDERHTAKVGTQLYMSPEQMAGKSYNYKVDIYSLGMIFFELLIPFHTQMERWKKLSDLRNDIYPYNFQTKHPKEYTLLQLMLATNPDRRVTTYGIRAKGPLQDLHPDNKIQEKWHFELPRGHIRTPSFGKSQSSSSNTSGD